MTHDSEATYLVGRNGENIPENIPSDPMPPLIKWMHEVVLPALQEAVDTFNKVMREVGEHLETKNEREKTRAYEHLITPPADHTHTKVTHTNRKPARPARMYRRRTP